MIDYREADLAADDRALCDWAVKLTLTPGATGADDLEVLRRHGFDDDAITVAAQVVGYFNYINRIADGLGVDEEPWMPQKLARNKWFARKGTDYGSGLRPG